MLNYAVLMDALICSVFIALLLVPTLSLSNHHYLFNKLTTMKEILPWAVRQEMSFTVINFI